MLSFSRHVIRAEIALELSEFFVFDAANLHQIFNFLIPS